MKGGQNGRDEGGQRRHKHKRSAAERLKMCTHTTSRQERGMCTIWRWDKFVRDAILCQVQLYLPRGAMHGPRWHPPRFPLRRRPPRRGSHSCKQAKANRPCTRSGPPGRQARECQHRALCTLLQGPTRLATSRCRRPLRYMYLGSCSDHFRFTSGECAGVVRGAVLS